MRLLVACSSCRRQYDASAYATGDRFRCHCGEVVTVPVAKAHDAAVVRCSSCGGPRAEGALACGYCSSDFTLREQDLHTLCPGCMARISDSARFCHHCATRVAPEAAAGQAADCACPACGVARKLSHRTFPGSDVPILECGGCAGLWLGHAVFEALVAKARQESADPVIRVKESGKPKAAAAPRAPTGPLYRACPVCGARMNRRNYGKSSRVVVDYCREHGVWFDGEELTGILAWVRGGGLDREATSLTAGPRPEASKAWEGFGDVPYVGHRPRSATVGPLLDSLMDWLGL
jgi:Zn-finger nucleic acid-binding protein